MLLGDQVGNPKSLILHLFNQTELTLSFLTLCSTSPHFGIQNLSQLCTFDLVDFNFFFTDLNKFINTFLEILLPPFVFFFDITRSRCSRCLRSLSAFSSTSICSLVSRLMLPSTFGSIVMVSGGNFSINLWTRASRYCLRVAKGLFSKLS